MTKKILRKLLCFFFGHHFEVKEKMQGMPCEDDDDFQYVTIREKCARCGKEKLDLRCQVNRNKYPDGVDGFMKSMKEKK